MNLFKDMETKHFSNNPNINKIDLENGEILEVSLITTGEILGHGMFLNEQGLDSFLQCVEGTQVKAYYKHSEDNEALNSIGYFENFKKKQKENGEYQIVGDFSALNAWKESNNKEYATFFELASKAPEVFGISVEAMINSGFYNEENELVMLEDGQPTEEDKIYAFCEKVLAWSVVSTPATNPNGLFSEKQKEFEENKDMENENEQIELQDKIQELEKMLETLTESLNEVTQNYAELESEKSELDSINEEYQEKIKGLESKIENFEMGSDPVDHNYAEEALSIAEQIKLEQDWGKKSKLVMSNLNNLSFQR